MAAPVSEHPLTCCLPCPSPCCVTAASPAIPLRGLKLSACGPDASPGNHAHPIAGNGGKVPISHMTSRDIHHPDKQSTDVPAGEAEARMQRFIEIDQAWKILGNEETKKEYDLQQREYELEQGCPVDTQISLEDMTWNHNDHCYSFTCRCGGKYTVSKNEVEDASLVNCDTCSLVIEII